MNLEYLEEAKEIMREYHKDQEFSQEALDICRSAALNRIASGEDGKDDNKQLETLAALDC